jgi:hypothetical protein
MLLQIQPWKNVVVEAANKSDSIILISIYCQRLFLRLMRGALFQHTVGKSERVIVGLEVCFVSVIPNLISPK